LELRIGVRRFRRVTTQMHRVLNGWFWPILLKNSLL
jgi:hypothetical protein